MPPPPTKIINKPFNSIISRCPKNGLTTHRDIQTQIWDEIFEIFCCEQEVGYFTGPVHNIRHFVRVGMTSKEYAIRHVIGFKRMFWRRDTHAKNRGHSSQLMTVKLPSSGQCVSVDTAVVFDTDDKLNLVY
ncbi:hypothetical protein RRG08_047966 [Elysia crispata]|uniref:Uncharacterized protein n=1 Tax=Elysia crispata TaxID=231223 RepID=A0AAE0ZUS2_9GAST|nr:hypothetical protein RRG08_047966 [Elysia crispata]